MIAKAVTISLNNFKDLNMLWTGDSNERLSCKMHGNELSYMGVYCSAVEWRADRQGDEIF